MSLRWLAARYAWIILLREAVRSPRWSAQQKRGAVAMLGMAVSVSALLSALVWVATGRRVLGFWSRPGVAFVDPFPALPRSTLTDAP